MTNKELNKRVHKIYIKTRELERLAGFLLGDIDIEIMKEEEDERDAKEKSEKEEFLRVEECIHGHTKE